nr:MAG TPA: hypothetical protein [Caudoviricetes sp.]
MRIDIYHRIYMSNITLISNVLDAFLVHTQIICR